MAADTPWTEAFPPSGAPWRNRPGAASAPRLRLVGLTERTTRQQVVRRPRAVPAADAPVAPTPAPVSNPLDPRWLLAVRTADLLQGPILPPEPRANLLRLGKVLGLTPFEANLVIAIVQDHARRGVRPYLLASTAEPQLRLVPLARTGASHRTSRWCIAGMVAAALAAELLALWLWLA